MQLPAENRPKPFKQLPDISKPKGSHSVPCPFWGAVIVADAAAGARESVCMTERERERGRGRGREGERERGREGEREGGREGERERGRKG